MQKPLRSVMIVFGVALVVSVVAVTYMWITFSNQWFDEGVTAVAVHHR